MNDRFKFRTYIPDLKFFKYWGWVEEWLYVNMCACGDYSMSELLKNYTDQCIGLKDKNDKLIYESDIVKETLTDFINEEIITVVKWDKLNATYNLENFQNCEREVIGNIYQNKSLLESGV